MPWARLHRKGSEPILPCEMKEAEIISVVRDEDSLGLNRGQQVHVVGRAARKNIA
jgi:hypothetical protein